VGRRPLATFLASQSVRNSLTVRLRSSVHAPVFCASANAVSAAWASAWVANPPRLTWRRFPSVLRVSAAKYQLPCLRLHANALPASFVTGGHGQRLKVNPPLMRHPSSIPEPLAPARGSHR
jgi:hypothetical protein